MRSRPVVLVIGVMAAIMLLVSLIQFLGGRFFTGAIEISSIVASTNVVVTDQASDTIVDTITEEDTTLRVPGGEYELTLRRGAAISTYSIVVNNRSTTPVVAAFTDPVATKTVISSPGVDIFYKNNTLQYLRPDLRHIYSTSIDQPPKQIVDDLFEIKSLDWMNNGGFVAQGLDDSLYLHTKGKLTALVTTSDDEFTDVQAAVDRYSNTFALYEDKTVSFSDGKKLNHEFGRSSDFSYSSKFALFSAGVPDFDDPDEIANAAVLTNYIVDRRNNNIATLDGAISTSKWSPSGKLVAMGIAGGVAIYDAEQQKVIAESPVQSDQLEWSRDSSILYLTDSDGLWQLTTKDNRTSLVASLPVLPASLFAASDGTLFLSLFEDNPKIVSIGSLTLSKTEQPSAQAGQNAATSEESPLDKAAPHVTTEFRIDVSSFGNETIVTITTYGILNDIKQSAQFERQTKLYRNNALEYLRSNGVDLNGLKVRYIPSL